MKTIKTTISPFIMLLIPALVVLTISLINPISGDDVEQLQTASYFTAPNFKGIVQCLFSLR